MTEMTFAKHKTFTSIPHKKKSHFKKEQTSKVIHKSIVASQRPLVKQRICIIEDVICGEPSSRSDKKGFVTLLQSSRKLGTSLSVGWKLAMSEWASSSGSSGPSASSRESVSCVKTAERPSLT